MPDKKNNPVEKIFEEILWKSRLITILVVIFSFMAALVLFIAGSHQCVQASINFISSLSGKVDYNALVANIINAIDLYLIGIVLLIFSFGVYELFISKIDPAKLDKEINILEITTLDSLKNKLLKVIIMVMVVYFFKSILTSHFEEPLELLYLGGAILAVSTCSFFIRKIEE
ncbi:MAG: YqhA family protein [Candidatus Omnitrophota bacterium]